VAFDQTTLGIVKEGQSVMIAVLVELEGRLLEAANRDQLIATLAERADCLPPEFTRERLEQQPTDRLRLLLLAARMIYVLRQQVRRTSLAT
jgi:hypothetical protein